MSQPMALLSTDMTEVERRMIVAALRGEAIDLEGACVRGSVLADLLRSARPGWVLPHAGLEISRFVVTGGLDLAAAGITTPLTFLEATFEPNAAGEALVLREARLARLAIKASRLDGSMIADRIEVGANLLIGETHIAGVLQARSAVIGGALAIEACEIGGGEMAVYAAGLRVAGPTVLRRSTFRGAVSLHRARLGAGLQADEAAVTSKSERALDLTGCHCDGDLALERASIAGGLVLIGARVSGQLLAAGIGIGSAGLDASGSEFARGIVLAAARLAGVLRIEGARIGNDVAAAAAEIHGGNTSIAARLARIGGALDLDAAKLVGTVEVVGAEVAGDLVLTGARLFGAEAALGGTGLRVGGNVMMQRAVVQGLVRLFASDVSGRVALSAASLKVDRGVCFDATAARVRRGFDLDRGLNASGGVVLDNVHVEDAAVVLTGSHITSALLSTQARSDGTGEGLDDRVQGAALHATSRAAADAIAVSLIGARIDRLVMPDRPEHRPRGIVDLTRAVVGEYLDHAAAWPPSPGQLARSARSRGADHLVLEGFTYARLANPIGDRPANIAINVAQSPSQGSLRVAWLDAAMTSSAGSARFQPVAWRQLAATLAAQGFGTAARDVTLAAARRRRSTVETSTLQRWASRLDDVLTLYGYAPWRPLVALVMLVAAFAALFAWADRQCPAAQCTTSAAFVAATDAPRAASFDALGYAVDAALPFVGLGYTSNWRVNPNWRPIGLLASATATDAPPRLTLGGLLGFARALLSLLGVGLLMVLLSALLRNALGSR